MHPPISVGNLIMLKCSLNIILLVAYIECHTGHEIDDTRAQSKMIGDDVARSEQTRLQNCHIWHEQPNVAEPLSTICT
jgi:hypothetical protein